AARAHLPWLHPRSSRRSLYPHARWLSTDRGSSLVPCLRHHFPHRARVPEGAAATPPSRPSACQVGALSSEGTPEVAAPDSKDSRGKRDQQRHGCGGSRSGFVPENYSAVLLSLRKGYTRRGSCDERAPMRMPWIPR